MFYVNLLFQNNKNFFENFFYNIQYSKENCKLKRKEKIQYEKIYAMKFQKKVLFYSSIPIFYKKNSSNKKKNKDCVFEIKFELTYEMIKFELFVGRFLNKNYSICLFSIRNVFKKKKSFGQFFFINFYLEKKKLFKKKKIFPHFHNKNLSEKKYIILNNFKVISKITNGLKDLYFSFFLKKNQKFKIFKNFNNFLKKFKNYEYVFVLMKNLILLKKKNIYFNSKNFLEISTRNFIQLWKEKKIFKKGISLTFFPIKFLTGNNLLISLSIIFSKKISFLNITECLIDWIFQLVKETYDIIQNNFFFSTFFFFTKYFSEEIWILISKLLKKKVNLKIDKKKFSKKFIKKNFFLIYNELNWNDKIYLSDFKINIFLKKVQTPKKKNFLFNYYKMDLIFYFKIILIKFFAKNYLSKKSIKLFFFYKLSSFFSFFLSEILKIKTWNNSHFQFLKKKQNFFQPIFIDKISENPSQKKKIFFLIFQKIKR
jgi:hypothetical protein